MKRRGLLVVLSGPAGSGKSTLAQHAVDRHPDICRSITATTRAPRGSEEDGRDYYFLSRAEFERRLRNDQFLEHAEFNGNLYGTPRAELESRFAEDRVVLLVIDVQGARQIQTRMLQAVFIFVLPPSPAVLRQRLASRGTEEPEEMEKRLAIAVGEVACLPTYDYLVINDDETAATDDLLGMIAFVRDHRIRGGEGDAWRGGAYEGWHRNRRTSP